MSRQLLLAKKEVTYGTPVVAAASDAVWAENVKLGLKGERVKGNPAKPGFGAVPGQIYGEHQEVTFEVPLSTSGEPGVAPPWAHLAKACGWGENIVADTSCTYGLMATPVDCDALTLRWREAKRTHVITGARGRMGLKMTAGQRLMLTFAFKGLHTDVTASAELVAADANFTGWSDSLPIAQGRTTFALAGVSMGLRDLSIDSADNVQFTDVPHQENVRLLGDRSFSGKLKANTPAIGDFNPEARWRDASILVASLVHNVGEAGSIVTVNSRFQIGEPTYGRDGGEDTFEASLEYVGSSLAVDDEIAIVLT